MALVGNMIATAFGGNPSIVNYDMFVAVFSMLSLFYLIPATLKESLAFHPMAMVALDAINVLLYFCGAVATAAYHGVHSCNNNDYTTHNIVTSGSPNTNKRCTEAQASTAFLWFGFAAFAASIAFDLMGGSSGGVSMRGGRGGVRRGPPAMSQV